MSQLRRIWPYVVAVLFVLFIVAAIMGAPVNFIPWIQRLLEIFGISSNPF